VEALLFELSDATVSSVDLLMQTDDGLITLVQALRECGHDITLLQQELLVTARLSLVFFKGRRLLYKL
jgi:hypothetical protein